jgi:hypothetical protein
MKKTVIAENPNRHAPRVKIFISLERDNATEEVGVEERLSQPGAGESEAVFRVSGSLFEEYEHHLH